MHAAIDNSAMRILASPANVNVRHMSVLFVRPALAKSLEEFLACMVDSNLRLESWPSLDQSMLAPLITWLTRETGRRLT